MLKMEGIQTLKGSWPWPWPAIRPYCIPSCITHRPVPMYRISWRWEGKNFESQHWSTTKVKTSRQRQLISAATCYTQAFLLLMYSFRLPLWFSRLDHCAAVLHGLYGNQACVGLGFKYQALRLVGSCKLVNIHTTKEGCHWQAGGENRQTWQLANPARYP